MPHIIHNINIEAAPARAIASEELDAQIKEELQKIDSLDTATASSLFEGGTPFGSKDLPHTICGKPYSECCKNRPSESDHNTPTKDSN